MIAQQRDEDIEADAEQQQQRLRQQEQGKPLLCIHKHFITIEAN
jgi:hypothetical protein